MSADAGMRRDGGFGRRSFLLTVAAGAAGAVFYAAGRHWFSSGGSAGGPWSGWLLDEYNRKAVERLGGAYRAAHPLERQSAVLADRIDAALAVAAGAGQTVTDQAAMVSLLQHRVREEYARDEVVRVNGWILSITEARLYALVAGEMDAQS
jgi:hypothetical protein